MQLGFGLLLMVAAGTGPLWADAIAWRALKFGNVAEWVAGLGASAAFLAAASEYRQRGIDQRSAQAVLVSAWAETIRQGIQDPTGARAWVRNGGTEPIYDVIVQVFLLYASSSLRAARPERTVKEWAVLYDSFNVVPPGTRDLTWTTHSYAAALRSRRPRSLDEVEGFDVVTTLSFRDARNRYWIRDFDGQLRQGSLIGSRHVLARLAPDCLERPEVDVDPSEIVADHP